MQIALLFGNRLTAWHARLFERLPGAFQVTAFMHSDNQYDTGEIRLPIERVPLAHESGNYLATLRELRRYKREHPRDYYQIPPLGLVERLRDFHVLHSWEDFTVHSVAAARAALRYNLPLVITVWDNIPHDRIEQRYPRENRDEVMRAATRYVVYTQHARRALLTQGIHDSCIALTPPGVDLDIFRPGEPDAQLRASWDPHGQGVVLLLVARMVWEKGIYDALHALKELRRLAPRTPWRLALVGEGPEREAVLERARMLGLQDAVTSTTGLAYEEMPRVYRSADVLLAPSLPTRHWREQFAMNVIEGMACGLPVVASTSGGLPEIVGPGGVCVPAGEHAALADAVLALDRANAGARAAQWAAQRYDAAESAQAMANVYRGLPRSR